MKQVNQCLRNELEKLGLGSDQKVKYNQTVPEIVTESLMQNETVLADTGALVVNTSPFTGRSPNDKYLVENGDPDLWYASGTEPMTVDNFHKLKGKLIDALKDETIYVRDVMAGADPENSLRIRVISDMAWQMLASNNMFIANRSSEPHQDPDFTLIISSKFAGDPAVDGLRSPAMVALNFEEKLVLIGNTRYAGEVKKSVFTLMNYVLPKRDILPLHCSAHIGKDGEVALFFG